MTAVDVIKEKITLLYQANAVLQVGILILHPKKHMENREAKIVGVYPNVFRIESQGKSYTLQYSDVLTKTVTIAGIEI